MGFPVAYSDLLLPKFLVHLLSLLGFIRKFACALFSLMGLGELLEPETTSYIPPWDDPPPLSVAASLIREILPVVKFSELEEDLDDPPERCAVCLYEFGGDDEIRRLANCRHIFHRGCLDGWMDHDQKTCPLCRTAFIPENMQEAFNERLWIAAGIADLYGDNSPAATATEFL